jgi:hypothetical protein
MRNRRWCFLAAAVLAMAVYADQAAGTDFHSTSAGFTVTVPDDWVQIPDRDFRYGADLIATQSNSNPIHWLTAYQQKNIDWFRFPFLMVGAMPYGENVEPNQRQIAQSIKNLLGLDMYQFMKDRHTKVFSKIVLNASVDSADWDDAQHAIHVVNRSNIATWGLVKSYTSVCFGKKGLIVIACGDTDDQFDARLPMFRKVCDSFRFDPGFAYDPSLSAASQNEDGPGSPEQMRIFGQPLWTWAGVAGLGLLIGLKAAAARSAERRSRVSQPPSPPGPPPSP